MPPSQRKSAVPVSGKVLSATESVAEYGVTVVTASQMLLPVAQVTASTPQLPGGTGVAQVAFDGALQVPDAHEKSAEPTAGDVLSVRVTPEPLLVPGATASQVSGPTVHVSVADAQAGGGGTTVAHVALVAALQVPALQVKSAAPVAGAVLSDTVTAEPLPVSGATASQESPPTVHVRVSDAHDGGGGGAPVTQSPLE
ncbi:hypothetical protein E4T66_18005 [Sinimarinibacterium sp. CAU 1509]|uniref:hypothetical protein n=1 Tax=Sinimarinibacterium sp. CAU 1509 TaxID=2562283 RepID=UPI0010AB6662|nr:hypothetical protein [Sinimarinibacterium sp. CAU 1509]TJY57300.1 hypothetical protein E4T66_18005 [Sinimarinibacterium sp. CAU 1509]